MSEIQYADLIGKKFRYGGRGPDYYDCYGLVREMLIRSGVENPPDYTSPSDGARIIALMLGSRKYWKECECKPGAVALIRLISTMHVGFILPNAKMIHTWDRSGGVVVEYLKEWEKRIITFYEYE